MLFYLISAQCNFRNRTAAALVRRPCTEPCNPSSNQCARSAACLCDHECGFSCINRGINLASKSN